MQHQKKHIFGKKFHLDVYKNSKRLALLILQSFDNLILSQKNNNIKKVTEIANVVCRSKRVFVYGYGRIGLVAKMFVTRLSNIGINAFFITDCNCQSPTQNDCIFLISNTGNTNHTVLTAKNSLQTGAKIICITNKPENNLLVKLCKKSKKHNTIIMYLNIKNTHNSILGTTFEQVCLVFLDGFLMSLIKKLNINLSAIKKMHNTL